MESGAVIKSFDVVKDDVASLGKGGEALVVDDFIFEAAPKGFDEGYLVLAADLRDSAYPLGGTSERMPRDFFKTSRCSRSLVFSARKRRISACSSATLLPGLSTALLWLAWRLGPAQR